MPKNRIRMHWTRSAAVGLASGAVGVAAMTVGERIEQRFTGRPDSFVPARTLLRLLGRPDTNRLSRKANFGMHAGQAILLGTLRGVMAGAGLRGPWASAMFLVVRLTNDQTLENATGVGAPPWTWPRDEMVVDVLHKAVYAGTTGAAADALAARWGPGPGQVHARRRTGRVHDIGPP